MIDHPSYRPSTTIRPVKASEGWRVTRKIGSERAKLYGYFEMLGDVAAIIRKAHGSCPSVWRVDGIRVPGTANASEIGEILDRGLK